MAQTFDQLLALLAKHGANIAPEIDPTIPKESIACSPNEDVIGTGMHKHLCGQCGYAWKHSNGLPRVCTVDENIAAHTCAKCGSEEWDKHGDY